MIAPGMFVNPQQERFELENLIPQSPKWREVEHKLVGSFWMRDMPINWDVLQIELIHNTRLEQEYRSKKREMEMAAQIIYPEWFAYRYTVRRELVSLIVRDGLDCTTSPAQSLLGDAKKGVHIVRYPDIQLKSAEKTQRADKMWLVMFKVCPGHVRHVKAEPNNTQPPSPNFDCHVSDQEPSPSQKTHEQFLRSLMYLYEFSHHGHLNSVISRPRHCLPYAVIQLQRRQTLSYVQAPYVPNLSHNFAGNLPTPPSYPQPAISMMPPPTNQTPLVIAPINIEPMDYVPTSPRDVTRVTNSSHGRGSFVPPGQPSTSSGGGLRLMTQIQAYDNHAQSSPNMDPANSGASQNQRRKKKVIDEVIDLTEDASGESDPSPSRSESAGHSEDKKLPAHMENLIPPSFRSFLNDMKKTEKEWMETYGSAESRRSPTVERNENRPVSDSSVIATTSHVSPLLNPRLINLNSEIQGSASPVPTMVASVSATVPSSPSITTVVSKYGDSVTLRDIPRESPSQVNTPPGFPASAANASSTTAVTLSSASPVLCVSSQPSLPPAMHSLPAQLILPGPSQPTAPSRDPHVANSSQIPANIGDNSRQTLVPSDRLVNLRDIPSSSSGQTIAQTGIHVVYPSDLPVTGSKQTLSGSPVTISSTDQSVQRQSSSGSRGSSPISVVVLTNNSPAMPASDIRTSQTSTITSASDPLSSQSMANITSVTQKHWSEILTRITQTKELLQRQKKSTVASMPSVGSAGNRTDSVSSPTVMGSTSGSQIQPNISVPPATTVTASQFSPTVIAPKPPLLLRPKPPTPAQRLHIPRLMPAPRCHPPPQVVNLPQPLSSLNVTQASVISPITSLPSSPIIIPLSAPGLQSLNFTTIAKPLGALTLSNTQTLNSPLLAPAMNSPVSQPTVINTIGQSTVNNLLGRQTMGTAPVQQSMPSPLSQPSSSIVPMAGGHFLRVPLVVVPPTKTGTRSVGSAVTAATNMSSGTSEHYIMVPLSKISTPTGSQASAPVDVLSSPTPVAPAPTLSTLPVPSTATAATNMSSGTSEQYIIVPVSKISTPTESQPSAPINVVNSLMPVAPLTTTGPRPVASTVTAATNMSSGTSEQYIMVPVSKMSTPTESQTSAPVNVVNSLTPVSPLTTMGPRPVASTVTAATNMSSGTSEQYIMVPVSKISTPTESQTSAPVNVVNSLTPVSPLTTMGPRPVASTVTAATNMSSGTSEQYIMVPVSKISTPTESQTSAPVNVVNSLTLATNQQVASNTIPQRMQNMNQNFKVYQGLGHGRGQGRGNGHERKTIRELMSLKISNVVSLNASIDAVSTPEPVPNATDSGSLPTQSTSGDCDTPNYTPDVTVNDVHLSMPNLDNSQPTDVPNTDSDEQQSHTQMADASGSTKNDTTTEHTVEGSKAQTEHRAKFESQISLDKALNILGISGDEIVDVTTIPASNETLAGDVSRSEASSPVVATNACGDANSVSMEMEDADPLPTIKPPQPRRRSPRKPSCQASQEVPPRETTPASVAPSTSDAVGEATVDSVPSPMPVVKVEPKDETSTLPDGCETPGIGEGPVNNFVVVIKTEPKDDTETSVSTEPNMVATAVTATAGSRKEAASDGPSTEVLLADVKPELPEEVSKETSHLTFMKSVAEHEEEDVDIMGHDTSDEIVNDFVDARSSVSEKTETDSVISGSASIVQERPTEAEQLLPGDSIVKTESSEGPSDCATSESGSTQSLQAKAVTKKRKPTSPFLVTKKKKKSQPKSQPIEAVMKAPQLPPALPRNTSPGREKKRQRGRIVPVNLELVRAQAEERASREAAMARGIVAATGDPHNPLLLTVTPPTDNKSTSPALEQENIDPASSGFVDDQKPGISETESLEKTEENEVKLQNEMKQDQVPGEPVVKQEPLFDEMPTDQDEKLPSIDGGNHGEMMPSIEQKPDATLTPNSCSKQEPHEALTDCPQVPIKFEPGLPKSTKRKKKGKKSAAKGKAVAIEGDQEMLESHCRTVTKCKKCCKLARSDPKYQPAVILEDMLKTGRILDVAEKDEKGFAANKMVAPVKKEKRTRKTRQSQKKSYPAANVNDIATPLALPDNLFEQKETIGDLLNDLWPESCKAGVPASFSEVQGIDETLLNDCDPAEREILRQVLLDSLKETSPSASLSIGDPTSRSGRLLRRRLNANKVTPKKKRTMRKRIRVLSTSSEEGNWTAEPPLCGTDENETDGKINEDVKIVESKVHQPSPPPPQEASISDSHADEPPPVRSIPSRTGIKASKKGKQTLAILQKYKHTFHRSKSAPVKSQEKPVAKPGSNYAKYREAICAQMVKDSSVDESHNEKDPSEKSQNDNNGEVKTPVSKHSEKYKNYKAALMASINRRQQGQEKSKSPEKPSSTQSSPSKLRASALPLSLTSFRSINLKNRHSPPPQIDLSPDTSVPPARHLPVPLHSKRQSDSDSNVSQVTQSKPREAGSVRGTNKLANIVEEMKKLESRTEIKVSERRESSGNDAPPCDISSDIDSIPDVELPNVELPIIAQKPILPPIETTPKYKPLKNSDIRSILRSIDQMKAETPVKKSEPVDEELMEAMHARVTSDESDSDTEVESLDNQNDEEIDDTIDDDDDDDDWPAAACVLIKRSSQIIIDDEEDDSKPDEDENLKLTELWKEKSKIINELAELSSESETEASTVKKEKSDTSSKGPLKFKKSFSSLKSKNATQHSNDPRIKSKNRRDSEEAEYSIPIIQTKKGFVRKTYPVPVRRSSISLDEYKNRTMTNPLDNKSFGGVSSCAMKSGKSKKPNATKLLTDSTLVKDMLTNKSQSQNHSSKEPLFNAYAPSTTSDDSQSSASTPTTPADIFRSYKKPPPEQKEETQSQAPDPSKWLEDLQNLNKQYSSNSEDNKESSTSPKHKKKSSVSASAGMAVSTAPEMKSSVMKVVQSPPVPRVGGTSVLMLKGAKRERKDPAGQRTPPGGSPRGGAVNIPVGSTRPSSPRWFESQPEDGQTRLDFLEQAREDIKIRSAQTKKEMGNLKSAKPQTGESLPYRQLEHKYSRLLLDQEMVEQEMNKERGSIFCDANQKLPDAVLLPEERPHDISWEGASLIALAPLTEPAYLQLLSYRTDIEGTQQQRDAAWRDKEMERGNHHEQQLQWLHTKRKERLQSVCDSTDRDTKVKTLQAKRQWYKRLFSELQEDFGGTPSVVFMLQYMERRLKELFINIAVLNRITEKDKERVRENQAKTEATSFYTPPKVVRATSVPSAETTSDKSQLISLGITNAAPPSQDKTPGSQPMTPDTRVNSPAQETAKSLTTSDISAIPLPDIPDLNVDMMKSILATVNCLSQGKAANRDGKESGAGVGAAPVASMHAAAPASKGNIRISSEKSPSNQPTNAGKDNNKNGNRSNRSLSPMSIVEMNLKMIREQVEEKQFSISGKTGIKDVGSAKMNDQGHQGKRKSEDGLAGNHAKRSKPSYSSTKSDGGDRGSHGRYRGNRSPSSKKLQASRDRSRSPRKDRTSAGRRSRSPLNSRIDLTTTPRQRQSLSPLSSVSSSSSPSKKTNRSHSPDSSRSSSSPMKMKSHSSRDPRKHRRRSNERQDDGNKSSNYREVDVYKSGSDPSGEKIVIHIPDVNTDDESLSSGISDKESEKLSAEEKSKHWDRYKKRDHREDRRHSRERDRHRDHRRRYYSPDRDRRHRHHRSSYDREHRRREIKRERSDSRERDPRHRRRSSSRDRDRESRHHKGSNERDRGNKDNSNQGSGVEVKPPHPDDQSVQQQRPSCPDDESVAQQRPSHLDVQPAGQHSGQNKKGQKLEVNLGRPPWLSDDELMSPIKNKPDGHSEKHPLLVDEEGKNEDVKDPLPQAYQRDSLVALGHKRTSKSSSYF